MVRTKGAADVSEEQKQRIMDLTVIGRKLKTLVEYFGMKQSTAANMLRRTRNNMKVYKEERS